MYSELKDKILVLFLTAGMSLDKWAKGGMLTREIKIYNEIAIHFKKIYFLTYGDESELKYKKHLADNIEILFNKNSMFTPMYSFFSPLIHKSIIKKADFLKTNQMTGSWTALIAKMLFKKKLIVRQGFPLLLTLKEKKESFIKIALAILIENTSYKSADKIIVTTLHDKKYVTHKYNVNPEKIAIISNYVDTDIFKPIETIKKEKKRMIFVGRFDREKNLISLIDAVKSMDVKLVLIGRGPMEKTLKNKVEKEEISNVSFPGIVPNEQLPVEFNKSEIFIQPSLYEGNPKTLLEAMSCGLPVIGTNVRGIKEIIKHEENGYLCELSSESIKEAIIKVLKSEEIKYRIGHNARETILAGYSLNYLVDKELSLLATL